MSAVPKTKVVKDRKYLDWLRTQPCIITGLLGNEHETVDPMHIGTAGKGLKTDDEALPVMHSIHARGHAQGEMSVLRAAMPDWLLREALRAYARQFYATYLDEQN